MLYSFLDSTGEKNRGEPQYKPGVPRGTSGGPSRGGILRSSEHPGERGGQL